MTTRIMDNGFVVMSLTLVPSGNDLLGEEDPVDNEDVKVRNSSWLLLPPPPLCLVLYMKRDGGGDDTSHSHKPTSSVRFQH